MSPCLVLLVCFPQLVAAPAQPGVHIQLTEILEEKLARIDEAVRSAESILREGKSVEEALGLLDEARRDREDALRVCGFIRTIASGDGKWASSLSLVRIRVLEQRPRKRLMKKNADALVSRAGGKETESLKRWMAFALVAERVILLLDKTQDLAAEVLDVRTVGSRYRPRTIMGRLRPDSKRADLRQGERIRLHNDPKKSGFALEVGPEYWAVIEPSNPWDAIPSLMGGKGRTYVTFAVKSP